MKAFLPFAVLLVAVTAVPADAQVRVVQDEPATVVAPTLSSPDAETLPTTPVLKAETRSSDTGETAVDAETDRASSSADAPAERAMMQDTPRNFWWLVGGIVLAGVILAVLL